LENLQRDVVYVIQVQARLANLDHEGKPSTIEVMTYPAAPLNFRVPYFTAKTVTLAWDTVANTDYDYIVQYRLHQSSNAWTE